MKAATWPRTRRTEAKLLDVDVRRGTIDDRRADDLPDLLTAGDLLVVNDAATLPASLSGRVEAGGDTVELRLLALEGDGSWRAVLFGAGDWRTPTEHRPAPPLVAAGATLRFGAVAARVQEVLPPSPRLLRVRFDAEGARFWSLLYAQGRPVQYSYIEAPLALWDVQTAYAGVPLAAEAPSAGYALSLATLTALRARGIGVASITHAAGLSATGDAALDAVLPLRERFWVGAFTSDAIAKTRAHGGRVFAVGTTVVRALEGRALQGGGVLRPGSDSTTLHIGPGFERRVVDGLLTGMHEPTESHYALLQAFAPRSLLVEAQTKAEAWGYEGHEFGDACLIR